MDSGALVALLRPHDRAHRRMLAHFRHLLDQRDVLVTTDIAIGETATQLRRDPGLYLATAFHDAIVALSPALRQLGYAVEPE